jgi:hypothetical protein
MGNDTQLFAYCEIVEKDGTVCSSVTRKQAVDKLRELIHHCIYSKGFWNENETYYFTIEHFNIQELHDCIVAKQNKDGIIHLGGKFQAQHFRIINRGGKSAPLNEWGEMYLGLNSILTL